MTDRHVRVKIKAAFDTAFNATFMTADERVKGLEKSLKGLKATSADIQNYKASRESVQKLTSDIAFQSAELQKATDARALATAAAKSFGDAERKAAGSAQQSLATYRLRREAYAKEKEAQEKLLNPSKVQKEHLRQLKRERDEAKKVHESATAELKKATAAAHDHRKAAILDGTSVELLTRNEKNLASTLKATESQLKKSEENAKKYADSLRKAGVNVDDLDQAEKKLNQTMAHQNAAIKNHNRARTFSDRAEDLRSDAARHAIAAVGFGYLFTKPLAAAIAFEKQMSRVKAMAGATSAEYKLLKEDARRLGAETVYSALQVAEAQNELATAGFRTNEIIETMPHLLALANSSMTSLARTAEITASVLRGFSIDVSEMERVGDALTAAYTSSASSLESLGEMLKYVASIATVTGSSLEEVLGASSVLHNNAITGSMAGTTMRAFLLRLSDPPRATKKVLEDMNVKLQDSAGNMRNWLDIIHDMNKALLGTGTAQQAAVWKKVAGEEAAPGVAKIAEAEKSGALQLEIKKYRLAPAFNKLGENLLSMPDAKIKELAAKMGVQFNRAMSGGGLIQNLSGSLKGLKGEAFNKQIARILSGIGMAPSLSDMKTVEFDAKDPNAQKALKVLRIKPTKALGGQKSNEELTREVRTALQTLPMEEQLKYIEIFFSKTRRGMRELLTEFSKSGKDSDQLVQALDETQNMKKTRKALSENAANDLEQISGDFGDMMVSLGDAFLPVLKEITDVIKPLTESFAKWISKHREVAKWVMITVGGLALLNGVLAVSKFALSGVVDAVGKTYKRFGKDKLPGSISRGLFRGMKRGGSGLLRGAKVLSKAGLGGLSKAARGGAKIGMKGISMGGSLLLQGAQKLIAMGPAISSAIGVVITGIRAVGAALLTTPIGLTITAISVALFLVWKNWGVIQPWLIKKWEALKVYFFDLLSRVTTAVKSAWDWIKEHMSWHPVVYIAKNWEKLIGMFKTVYEKIKPYISKIFPTDDTDISITGPEKPGFLSRMVDAADKGADDAKDFLSGLFESPVKDIKSAVPTLPGEARSEAGYTQRNVITVNAKVHVESGPKAPIEVAQKIKAEIQSAFRMTPSFDLFDEPMVS
jgi:TP901 family phage tail tape measure protein